MQFIRDSLLLFKQQILKILHHLIIWHGSWQQPHEMKKEQIFADIFYFLNSVYSYVDLLFCLFGIEMKTNLRERKRES
jgi:hypothetical protein